MTKREKLYEKYRGYKKVYVKCVLDHSTGGYPEPGQEEEAFPDLEPQYDHLLKRITAK